MSRRPTQQFSSSKKPAKARLAYVPPEREKRSRSLGRSLLSKMNIFSSPLQNSSNQARRSSPPDVSTESSNFQDASTATIESSSSRQSRSSTRSSRQSKTKPRVTMEKTQDEAPQPLPRKTSLGKSSASESESRNLSSLDSTLGRNIRNRKPSTPIPIRKRIGSISSNATTANDESSINSSMSTMKPKDNVIFNMSNNNHMINTRSQENRNRSGSSTSQNLNSFNNSNFQSNGSQNFESHLNFSTQDNQHFPNRSSNFDSRDFRRLPNSFTDQGSLSNLEQRTPVFEKSPRFDFEDRGFAHSNFDPPTAAQWKQISQRNFQQQHWTPQSGRRNFDHRLEMGTPVAVLPPPPVLRREKTEFWTPSPHRRQFDEQRLTNNWTPTNNNQSWADRTAHHRSSEDILSMNNERKFRWDDGSNIRSRSTWHIDREDDFRKQFPQMNKFDLMNRQNNNQISNITSKSENQIPQPKNLIELNSFQVFRQNKYRERLMAERKIRSHQHLQHNDDCNELVQILGKEFHPSMYENSNPLDAVQQESKSNIITSSRIPIQATRIEMKPKFPVAVPRDHLNKEHIYAEIDENLTPIHTPVMHRKVTFLTTHDPVAENDSSFSSKKILPATLWGIVEVKSALREKEDEERRGIARLCYHAVKMAAPDNSLKFLGKVDRNRYGESVYVVLENKCFEIRDGEGLIIAKHKSRDISVVTEIEGDANVFVYIGRCKFAGRLGMVLKFNKFKHIGIVIDFFKNG